MKRILTALALTVCMVASADEGMWLLPLLQKFNSDAMRNIAPLSYTAEDAAKTVRLILEITKGRIRH